MRIIYTTIAALFLVLTCSCSLEPILKIDNLVTAKKQVPREIEILPIVLGLDPSKGEEFDVLNSVNSILNEANINITYKKVIYIKQHIPIQECNFMEFMYLSTIDIDALLDYQCKARVVVFFEVENSCLNLRGCAPLKGILSSLSRMWMFLSGNAVDDSRVMAHEFGHLLGATHTDDFSLMHPWASQTQNWHFSDKSKREMAEILKLAYGEPELVDY